MVAWIAKHHNCFLTSGQYVITNQRHTESDDAEEMSIRLKLRKLWMSESSKDFNLSRGYNNSLCSLTCALVPVFDGVMLSKVHVAGQIGSRVGTVEPPWPFEWHWHGRWHGGLCWGHNLRRESVCNGSAVVVLCKVDSSGNWRGWMPYGGAATAGEAKLSNRFPFLHFSSFCNKNITNM